MAHSFSTEIEIANTTVCLALTYSYIPGVPAQGPTWSSGGQPEEPPEVDILTIEWSKKPGAFPAPAAFEWHKLEHGPMFNLIANDEHLYIEICDRHDESIWEIA